MKKSLLALACLGAACTMASAAQVELYGTVDYYIAVNHEGSSNSVGLQSGGTSASFWGIKGSEELGNGMKVVFKLEDAFTADDGATSQGMTGQMWEREAWIGVEGRYGHLSFGRQYTPHFLVAAMTDPTWLSLGSSWSGFYYPFGQYSSSCVMGGDNPGDGNSDLVRQNNSVFYASPRIAGFQGMAFMSLGERSKTDKSTSASRANNYNLAVNYANGPLFVAASVLYQDQRNGIAVSSIPGAVDKDHSVFYNFAASWDFGVTKPVVNFIKKTASDTKYHPDFWCVQLGTTTPIWGGQLATSASYMHNQSEKGANAYAFGTKYLYPLSKRTSVYAGVEAIWNERNAIYAIEAGPDSSSHFATTKGGHDPVQVFVGMNHRF